MSVQFPVVLIEYCLKNCQLKFLFFVFQAFGIEKLNCLMESLFSLSMRKGNSCARKLYSLKYKEQ